MKMKYQRLFACLLVFTMMMMVLPPIGTSIASAQSTAFGFTAEKFNYLADTKLNTTEAKNGWSSGWKQDWELTGELPDSYVVTDEGSFRMTNKLLAYRGLDTPIRVDANQDYYVFWKMRVDGTTNTIGSTRANLALSSNTFFGMSRMENDGLHRLVGRFLGNHITTETEFKLNQEYSFLLKIGTNNENKRFAGLKVFGPGVAEITEPQSQQDWTLYWNITSKNVFDTIGLQADLYSDKGSTTFDDIILSSRWEDIEGTAAFKAIEDFAYAEGTKLQTTTADDGWKTGWKADIDLRTELDPSIQVNQFATVEHQKQMNLYRGMIVPLDLAKEDSYYLKSVFSIQDNGSGTEGKALLMLNSDNYFGAEFDSASSSYRLKAKFLGDEQTGEVLENGEMYSMVVKVKKETGAVNKAYVKIYASNEEIGNEPVGDWDLILEGTGDTSTSFDVLGFEADLTNDAAVITLDSIYAAPSWDTVTAKRTFFMEDWFDQGAGKKLNETIAAGGWTSGWKQDIQLQQALSDDVQISGQRSVKLKQDESIYRGIMPMTLSSSDVYYMSWRLGTELGTDEEVVESKFSPTSQAAVYLDENHYFTMKYDSDNQLKWAFYSNGEETEADTVLEKDKIYTLAVKIAAAGQSDEAQLFAKLYPRNESLVHEPDNEEVNWDIQLMLPKQLVIESVGAESKLGINNALVIDQVIMGSTWDEINRSEDNEVAQALFKLITFPDSANATDALGNQLLEVKRLKEAGNYAAALDRFKDYYIDKMSGFEFGVEKPGFGTRGSAEQAMNGIIVTYVPPDGTAEHIIGEPGYVEWYKLSPEDPNFPGSLAEMDFTMLLSQAFRKTEDPKYLKRWNDYWDDFARHNNEQWHAAIALPDRAEFKRVNNTWDSKLRLANRSDMFIQQMSNITRPLSEDGKYVPVDKEINLEDVKKSIDPVTLALTLILLEDKHLNKLEIIQSKPGGAPNQNFQAGISMYRASLALSEFNNASVWGNRANKIITDYIDPTIGAMMKDGSDLEQSFNYNGTAIELGQQLKDLYEKNGIAFDNKFQKDRLRFMASLIRPSGNMPGLSKMDNRPFFEKVNGWQEFVQDYTVQQILDNVTWLDEEKKVIVNDRENPKPAPAFNSIYYPYGGFTIMRSGWDSNAYHLFMKSSRRGTGHSDESGNQIQLTAFGKTMLVDAGPDTYSPTDKEMTLYLLNSYSHNTMIVNGLTQVRTITPGVHSGYQDPIDARWLTSSQFDFSEGLYESGYGTDIIVESESGEKTNVKTRTLTNLNHGRQVIYIKALGMYVVTDRMLWQPKQEQGDTDSNDVAANKYTQIWNFDYTYSSKNVCGNFASVYVGSQVEDDGKPVTCPETEGSNAATQNNHIFTAADEGPNIELYHFLNGQDENEPLTYNKYFAYTMEDGQVRGYYRHKTTDAKEKEKPDVHLEWEREGESDQLLVTFIHPLAQGNAAGDLDVTKMNLDPAVAEGFTASNGNAVLHYVAAKDDAGGILEVGPFTITGEALLAVQQGNQWRGIALGAQSFSAKKKGNSGNTVTVSEPNFEFLFNEATGKIATKTFGVPTGFDWKPAPGNSQALVPDYGSFYDSDPVLTVPGGGGGIYTPPVTDTDPTQVIIQQQDLDSGSNDQSGYSLSLADEVSSIVIPRQVAKNMGNKPLTLQWDNRTIELPAQMIGQLLQQANDDSNGQIVITATMLSEQDGAGILRSSGKLTADALRPAGQAMQFEASYVDDHKRSHDLNEFQQPAIVSFQLPEHIDAELAGIYYWNGNGDIVYIGGKLDAATGMISATVYSSGKLVVAEYKKVFADTRGHWGERVIQKMAAKHIVNGTSNDTFAPDRSVTRAEFTAILARALGLNGNTAAASFSDIEQTAWYASSVAAASAAGIISGKGNGKFAPNENITREEMAVMLKRAYTHLNDALEIPQTSAAIKDLDAIPAWAKDAVMAAYSLQLLKGRTDGRFDGKASLTRAEAAQVTANLLDKQQ
ncbi:S-layer homology domain-containing protein [Paenibacillus sp. IITD108]|uniref:S-layer homology domain-containing protein n=1 Tax=Paenibacillus sp. IITD108 TaxID=3116649 RepID=UPI002F3F062B